MARVRLLLACVIAGTAGAAWAEVVPWLYDGEVAVASQSDADRRRGAAIALAEVLARITGFREVPFSPVVDAAIRNPDQFYVRYGFARHDIEPAEDGAAGFQTHLEIPFERSTLLDLLRRSGLPVWSADRPTTLVWVVLQRDSAREVASAATFDAAAREVVSTMHREARRRGIVLTFPLMDLEDRGLLTTDLWGRFWTAIGRASSRFPADIVLLGRLTEDAVGRWMSHWELQSPNGENELAASFVHRGASAGATAGEAVHRLADALAQRFAVRGGDLDVIALTVRGARTARAYAALLAHLRSREYIDRVDVRAIDPDALHLKLQSRSGRDQLVELLLMGGYLSASRTTSPTAPPGLELNWMGAR
ncbi:MAG: DUF2066 domain-containing protein [Gammaproteobacteria bacterium]|nr:DUF2066 domain-containing protein [Gammaproteobacteria bacterium]